MKDLQEKSTAPSFVDRDQEKKREKAMAARELRDEEEAFLKTLGKGRKIRMHMLLLELSKVSLDLQFIAIVNDSQ